MLTKPIRIKQREIFITSFVIAASSVERAWTTPLLVAVLC
jgi:hypothetical protein